MENAGLTALSEHDRRHGIEILRDDVTIGWWQGCLLGAGNGSMEKFIRGSERLNI